MSIEKEYMAQQDYLYKVALEILELLKIIEKCPFCEYYCEIDGLNPEIYGKATIIAKERYKITEIKELHQMLKKVYDEAGIESIADHLEFSH